MEQSDLIHDTLWRIIEVFGEPVSGSQRHEIDRVLAGALDAAEQRGRAQERERCVGIASNRAFDWRNILEEQPDSVIADNRWHEACDISVLLGAILDRATTPAAAATAESSSDRSHSAPGE